MNLKVKVGVPVAGEELQGPAGFCRCQSFDASVFPRGASSLFSAVQSLCKSTKLPTGLMGRKGFVIKYDWETLGFRVQGKQK